MAGHLDGKSAVVTGAGRGIGRAIARRLAAEGAAVVVNDLGSEPEGGIDDADPGPAEAVVDEIVADGGRAVPSVASVADPDAAQSIVDTAVSELRVDMLVNVAGNARVDTWDNMSVQLWRDMTAVHLNGTFYLCHAAWPVMREQRFGRIVNTTSRAWITAEATPSYAASKAGVFGLMQSLASQGSVYGITANCISPEAYTRLVDWSRPLYEEFLRLGTIDQALYDTLDGIPPPDFVAPIVAYLGTDAAANITARVFEVRGNRLGLWQGPVEARMAFRESEPLEPWTVDELATVVPGLLNTV